MHFCATCGASVSVTLCTGPHGADLSLQCYYYYVSLTIWLVQAGTIFVSVFWIVGMCWLVYNCLLDCALFYVTTVALPSTSSLCLLVPHMCLDCLLDRGLLFLA